MTSEPSLKHIRDNQTIMRRVRADQTTHRRDGAGKRPSSNAYIQGTPDSDVSVYLASETTPATITQHYPGTFVAEVAVSVIRRLGLEVERQPIPGDPGHCNIKGRKIRSIATEIAKSARWMQGYGPD